MLRNRGLELPRLAGSHGPLLQAAEGNTATTLSRVDGSALRSPRTRARRETTCTRTKEGCLEWMILFGEDSLRNVVRHFIEHYHLERNHQGLNNRLITPIGTTIRSGPVQKRQRLGGMLNYYYRGAA